MEIERALELLNEIGVEVSVVGHKYYLGSEVVISFSMEQVIVIAQALEITM